MRTVTVPPSAGDRVAALRLEALYTTDRIVAVGGVPLMFWSAWSVWPENPAIGLAAAVIGVVLALPVLLPARSLTLRRIMPVVGLASVSFLTWLVNGANTTTGLLMWSTGIVTAIALGRRAAIAVALGWCLLLVSAPVARSEWLLPIAARSSDPEVLTRTVLAFGVLSATVLSVAWGVITPLERTLAAATDLVEALRQEQRARAALDVRLAQNDQDIRLGIARQLEGHLRTQLTSLERSLAKAAGHDTDDDKAVADEAIVSVGQLIDDVRAASRQLRPVLLEDAGLVPALESLAHSEFGGSAIPYEIDLRIDVRLPVALEVACYRIVQEAISNVVQHAQATHARLTASQDDHRIEFVVEDNGIGFDPQRVMPRGSPGMGLFGMRRRSDTIGGTLQIDSAAARGTRVHFSVPLITSA